jgi:hypothetical protein
VSDRIEEMLKRMPLAPPPASLDGWVARRRCRRAEAWVGVGVGLAAAAVVVATAWLAGGMGAVDGGGAAPPVATAEAVCIERVWSRVADDGVVVLGDEGPFRQWRKRSVRYVWCREPGEDAAVEIILPREDVILVACETY